MIRKPALRLPALLAAGALAAGVSGCGLERRPPHPANVSATELSNGAEPYFWAGPVTYQVQISRAMNPFNNYDVQYFAGVKGAQSISPQQLWYGVFLWAKNQSGRYATTADRFELVDSAGDVYRPTPLNSGVNPFAWTAQRLSPNQIEPSPDGAAGTGSAGGGLILFKVNESVYSNRPLTLLVYAKGATKPSSRVSLDL